MTVATKAGSILFSGLILFIAFFLSQSNFYLLGLSIGLCFILYFFAGVHTPTRLYFVQWRKINLLLKGILIFSFPSLSDDIYRFFWDGQWIWQGIHPYAFIPSETIAKSVVDPHIYSLLNSKNYYTVYPPLLQILFSLIGFISFHQVFIFSIVWKGILLLADYGIIYYLIKVLPENEKHGVYWYAWNPLIIIEILGNGHPEGLAIFTMTLMLYYFSVNKLTRSAILLGLAGGIKLFPIAILPFMAKSISTSRQLKFISISILVFIVSLIGIYPYMDHFYESIQLYFKKFEFNGSIYEIWKYIDFKRLGFNNILWIGRWMTGLFVCIYGILWLIQRRNLNSAIRMILFMWTIYLLLSTTVHPWYITPLVLLSVLTGFHYPLIWSAAIFFSYNRYTTEATHELIIYSTIIEYTLVLAGIFYDFYRYRMGYIKPTLFFRSE